MIEVLGPAEIHKGGRWMPVTEEVQLKFDHDLEFGRLGEDFVKAFQDKNTKVEVKTERDTWKKTGNIAIELSSRGKLSGLNTTKADWWCQTLTLNGDIVGIYMWPIKQLKHMVKHIVKYGRGRLVMGGDDNTSELALIPLEDLTNGF